jgi:hypothetical protein
MPTNSVDFNDLSIYYGVSQITLGGGYNNMPVSTFYVEDWTADTQVNVVNVPNEVGKIRGRVIVDQDKSGTAVLQFLTGSNMPRIGCTGSVPANYAASGSGASIMVSSVSSPHSVNDYGKVTIQWLLASP